MVLDKIESEELAHLKPPKNQQGSAPRRFAWQQPKGAAKPDVRIKMVTSYGASEPRKRPASNSWGRVPLTFPYTGDEEPVDEPVVIRALIGNCDVSRMYVDTG